MREDNPIRICLYIPSASWLKEIREEAWRQRSSLSRLFVQAVNFFIATAGTRKKIEGQS